MTPEVAALRYLSKITFSIETDLFEKPSGNVRGTVVAMLYFGGTSRRVAFATLFTDRVPAIRNYALVGKFTVDEIAKCADALNAFAAEVRKLTA